MTMTTEQQELHTTQALQSIWDEYHRRSRLAQQAAAELDKVSDFIRRAREAQALLPQAQADEKRIRDNHNELLGTATAMRDFVTELCERHGLPLPQDPPPEPLPVGTASTGENPLPEAAPPAAPPVAEDPLGGAS